MTPREDPPSVAPDQLDDQILEFVKDINPSGAYLAGFNDYAGKLFIASRQNTDEALKRARGLRGRAKTPLQRKLLDSIEANLLFDEPQPVLDDIVGAIYAHLVKEGVKVEHMISLLGYASKDIDACRHRFSGRKIPVAVKGLALYRLGGALEILDSVKAESKSPEVKQACESLKANISEYVKIFELPGWGKGEFPNVERIFKELGSDLGREDSYRTVLKNGYDYEEGPEELEQKAMSWIDEELPRFRKVTERLAKQFGCKPVPEEVEKMIDERNNLDPKRLVGVTLRIRRVIQRLVDQELSRINPRYRTMVIETPSYLTGVIPTAAAQFFDTFTSRPFQIYFLTTDPKKDPDKSVAALINTLVHEEYGHCLHHSNSAVGFVRRLNPLQAFPGLPTGAPITEGLSFNREIEFLELSKGIGTKKRLTSDEKAYATLMERYGGLRQVNGELEFMTRRWRIVRFLRVIGDVWVNTGKKSLLEFVDWAHEHTGVPRSSVYFQLFPAHEGTFPGYATTYAVVGQQIRAIEKRVKGPGKRIKFATYLCSIGFPPKSMYIKELKDYASRLK